MAGGRAETAVTGERLVLIVEDEEAQRELLASVFAESGHSVATAASARAALAMLRAGLEPRLVVADLAMPDMDGEDFCLALQGDADLADTRVVLFSGREDLERVATRLGVPFVAKPHAGELLLRAAHQW